MKPPEPGVDPRRPRRGWRRGAIGLVLVTVGVTVALLWIGWRPRPNVVFILIDTLRADRIGAYGSRSTARTPVIDRLAREGILYEGACAPSSWTLPSVASLFLGKRPLEHGVLQFWATPATPGPTLAQVLADHDYDTAAFVANTAVKSIPDCFRGFSTVDVLRSPKRDTDFYAVADASAVRDRVLAWLDARARPDRPVFLYLHFMEPHAPYLSHPGFTARPRPEIGLSDDDLRSRPLHGLRQPEASRREFWRLSDVQKARLGQLYDGEVSYLDYHLGLLLAGLQARGVLGDAIIALTSDHGEELGEHGLYGHGLTLFEPEVRVPLVITFTGTPRVGRVAEPVETAGLAAALLQELGLPVPPEFTAPPIPLPHRTDARPTGAASEMEPMGGARARFGPHRRTWVEGTRKAYKQVSGDPLVTDLATDPHEDTLHAPVTKEERRLVTTLDAVGSYEGPVRPPVQIDAETRRRLEAMGYVLPDDPAPTSTTLP